MSETVGYASANFTPGTWGYVEPPEPDELPMERPNGDRYNTNLVVTDAKGRVEVIGAIYHIICTDADRDWAKERTRANARLVSVAPRMYEMLCGVENLLRIAVNESGCVADWQDTFRQMSRHIHLLLADAGKLETPEVHA